MATPIALTIPWRCAGALGLGIAAAGGSVHAQGCMPLRFTSPSLGGQATTFLRPHEWQAGLAMRRVATNRFFVGTAENEAAAPGGQPLRLRLNSADVSISYGLSERTALSLTVPLFYGTGSNFNPDGVRHQVSTSGVGDVNALATLWLAAPSQHSTGNVQVGLGLKAPTGSHTLARDFFAPDGSVSQQPVTQTLQARRRRLGHPRSASGVSTNLSARVGLRLGSVLDQPARAHRRAVASRQRALGSA